MAKRTENKGGGGKAPAKQKAAPANAAPKKAPEASKAPAAPAAAPAAQPTQAEAPAKKVESRKKGTPVREM